MKHETTTEGRMQVTSREMAISLLDLIISEMVANERTCAKERVLAVGAGIVRDLVEKRKATLNGSLVIQDLFEDLTTVVAVLANAVDDNPAVMKAYTQEVTS